MVLHINRCLETFYQVENLKFCKFLIKKKPTSNLTKNGKIWKKYVYTTLKYCLKLFY